MEQQLLSLAELLQTIGGIELPADPERTAATTELLLESHYQHLGLLRFTCTLEVAAPEVHVFSLEEQGNAEAAYALELPLTIGPKWSLPGPSSGITSSTQRRPCKGPGT